MDQDLVNVLIGVGCALSSVLLYFLGVFVSNISKKIKSAYVQEVINRARVACGQAYLSIQQSYVQNLKDTNGDGKIDQAEQHVAFECCLAQAESFLGIKGFKELANVLGGQEFVRMFLGTEIEANVAASKKK